MTTQISRLLSIMATLRDPKNGCEWDRAQNFHSIAPYTIEEAYEVSDAIDRGDMADLREELGDLLFQVVFHSQMAKEAGDFSFEDVAKAISDKMEARHPHIFGDEGGQMVMANNDENGFHLDKDFYIDFPKGYRSHQIRLEGGDCSTDSFCYPSV